MEEVKSLLRSEDAAVEAFSAMGVPVMCSVIREDQDDLELVQVQKPCIPEPMHTIKHSWFRQPCIAKLL
jgi:hypothetical protein